MSDLRIDISRFRAAVERVSASAFRVRRGLLRTAAAVAESQTRRRISERKASPDGERWAPWTARTAERRRGTQSLLQYRGHLHDSIVSESSVSSARVGSALVYARAHQEGRPEINLPARPYLGIGSRDAREIDAEIERFMARAFA